MLSSVTTFCQDTKFGLIKCRKLDSNSRSFTSSRDDIKAKVPVAKPPQRLTDRDQYSVGPCENKRRWLTYKQNVNPVWVSKPSKNYHSEMNLQVEVNKELWLIFFLSYVSVEALRSREIL